MKKILLSLLVTFTLGLSVFAESSDRSLLVGVSDFATEKSDTWTIYDGNFTSINDINGEYVFDGAFVVKIIGGLSRYDFTCTIKGDINNFSVELNNVNSKLANKDGSKKDGAKVTVTADRVCSEYAKQMKTEIQQRLSSWSDDVYNAKLNKTVTSPVVLAKVADNSSLAFKKFMTQYNPIGKNAEFVGFCSKIDESTVKGYNYVVEASVFKGIKVTESLTLTITTNEYMNVVYYTNDDKVLGIKTASLEDIYKGNVQGSEFKINGKLNDIKINESGISKGSIRNLEIYE